MERRTKIVATIGPACSDAGTLEQLMQAGMNVARLNFSHGTHADHAASVVRLREISGRLKWPLSILQDLQGPKIRTGDLVEGKVNLIPGQEITLTTRRVPGDDKLVTVDFPELPECVSSGGRILIDDGTLELNVISTGEDWVQTRVVVGGVLKPHKGINLPNACFTISALSQKDEEDLAFGLEQGVDFVALSFVRTAEDIKNLRAKIAEYAPDRKDTPVIAKLERPEALDNLDEIVQAADGVMVARGDLGVEMSPQAVPIAQKRIIECANRYNRIVITATQMLDSMINNPRPTRAEASDVANAIFDGTDAVMLSGETAAGKYPVRAVETMDAIARQAEEYLSRWGHWKGPVEAQDSGDDTYFMTLAVRALAHDRNVAAIAIFTMTGYTALLMSKTRPEVPILAFTPVEETFLRLPMYWGVVAYRVPDAGTIETMLDDVEAALTSSNLVSPGQQVVLTCGYPVGELCPTNLALLHTVRSK